MKRRQFSSGFKAKVAMEAVKGEKTIVELMAKYKVHSTQITKWKKQGSGSNAGYILGKDQTTRAVSRKGTGRSLSKD